MTTQTAVIGILAFYALVAVLMALGFFGHSDGSGSGRE